MTNKFKIYISIALVPFIMTGCFNGKTDMPESDKQINKHEDMRLLLKSNPDKVLITPKDKIYTKNQTIRSLVKKLALRNNENYLISGNFDIKLPNTRYQISSIEELQKYIEEVTEYKLTRTNKVYDKIQKFSIKRKIHSFESQKFDVEMKANMTLADIFDEIGAQTGYSVIVNNDFYEEFTTEKKFVQFHGKTLASFFKYSRNKFNVFIDIDEENKIITLSKYKYVIYDIPIIAAMLDIQNKVEATLKSSETGPESKTTMDNSIKFRLYDELRDYLKILLKTSVDSESVSEDSFFIHKSTNKVYVNTTYATNAKVSKIISDFVEDIKINIDIHIITYDISLSDSNEMGISWNVFFDNLKNITGASIQSLSTASVPGVANDFINGSSPDGGGATIGYNGKTVNFNAFMSAIGEYGNLKTVNEINLKLNNGIPTVYNKSLEEKFLSGYRTEQDDSGNSRDFPEFETSITGTLMYAYAKYLKDSDDIVFSFSPTYSEVVDIKKIPQTGKEAIQLPIVGSEKYMTNMVLKDGEKILIVNNKKDKTDRGYKGFDTGLRDVDVINKLSGIDNKKQTKTESFTIVEVNVNKRY